MFFSCYSFSQGNYQIGIMSKINHTFLEGEEKEDYDNIEESGQSPLGYGIDVSLVANYATNRSWELGLGYAEQHIYPNYLLEFYYVGYLMSAGDTLTVQAPYLTHQRFRNISFYSAHKRYYNLGKKWSFYTHLGMRLKMTINKMEQYEDFGSPQVQIVFDKSIRTNNNKTQFFSTSIEIGLGFRYELQKDWSIIVQSTMNVIELRRENTQEIESWPMSGNDKKVWWEKGFLPIGAISIGLGLQRSF